MKIGIVKIVVVTSLVLFGCQQGYSQGTFQNLNFESPIQPLNPGLVPIANAAPGWTDYVNGNTIGLVFFRDIPIEFSPWIAVVDSLTPVYQPIRGNYSVLLRNAAIGQSGQMPNDSVSLLFLREAVSSFQVSFGGHSIPLVQFGTSGNNIIMAGDISMFAGQTGELLFAGTGLFDSIQFSSTPIPEPGMISLFVVGALLLGWRRTVRPP